jgi:hypothetical protein
MTHAPHFAFAFNPASLCLALLILLIASFSMQRPAERVREPVQQAPEEPEEDELTRSPLEPAEPAEPVEPRERW